MSFRIDPRLIVKISDLAKSPAVLACVASTVALPFLPAWNQWMSQRTTNNNAIDDSWNWKQEIVVVTGGSSGIGAQIVTRLEKAEVKVIILDLNPPTEKTSSTTSFYRIDLTCVEEIVSTAQKIKLEHGDPTVIINNAGIGQPMPMSELPASLLHKMFDVNIIAPILLVQQFLPSMIGRNHGHIVNVSSMAAFCSQATNVPYACTKVGLLAYHEGLIQELRHVYNAPLVRATVVHPTWVRTAMTKELFDGGKLDDDTISPEQVAGAIVDQLFTGYGNQLILPPQLGKVSLLRGLPTWIQEKVRDSVTMTVLRGMNMA